ncbi:MAG: hypothetical protein M1815_001354 [Lichina confinis]|nr:MAG: hypothetical protein M1815_001354 [Lichina confinis]
MTPAISQETRERALETREKACETTDKAYETASQLTRDGRDKAHEVTARVAKEGRERASSFIGKIQQLVDRIIPPESRRELAQTTNAFASKQPLLASFVATQLALSALPLLLFFSFSVITLVVVAATAVLFAAFWIGAALLILVPTLFVTFFTALFIWIWVVGAYALWRFTYRMTTVGRNASAESRPVLPARTALQEPEPPKGVEGVYLDRQPNISSGDQERNAGLQEGPGSQPAEDGTDYDGGLEDMVVQPAAPARNGVGNNHGQGVARGDNGIGTEYDRMLGSRAGHSGRNQYGAPNFGPGATGWGNFSNPRPAEDVSKASVERPV